jgi:hypothetical protein
MGGFIILAVLVLPRGIAGLGQRIALRRTDTARDDDEA